MDGTAMESEDNPNGRINVFQVALFAAYFIPVMFVTEYFIASRLLWVIAMVIAIVLWPFVQWYIVARVFGLLGLIPRDIYDSESK
jgi:hypothetical protein